MPAPIRSDAVFEPLVGIVTTDLAAITRGRFVAERRLEDVASAGVGWLHANLCLTAFSSIADPNPWGSRGDLRILPDLDARYRTTRTGSPTPFDLVIGNLVELDGVPWSCCCRTLLQQALDDLKAEAGLTLAATFEQEFQLVDAALPPSHSFAYGALRRTDPFGPTLMAALEEAQVRPEVIIAEYGKDQFETTCAPAPAVIAADRCIATREIVRETARNCGWKASFSPKVTPDSVGNGVHIHFSFNDEDGKPATYDGSKGSGLSGVAASFCAGILRHLPAITVLTASSVPSYYRLTPHTWSASYTWLGQQDREASLRICPVVTRNGLDPAPQYNIEYRPADATANPYLALAAIVRAGLEGVRRHLPPPAIVVSDPTLMTPGERESLGLVRLPESLPAALAALEQDETVNAWFDPKLIESFVGVKQSEIATLADRDPASTCEVYRELY